MANNIKGITIEIGGDTTKLDKALKEVNQKSRSLQNELKEVNKALKLDPKNTELLAQKQQILKEAIENTEEKLKTLNEAQEQAKKQLESGDLGEEQYRALQREISNTEASLKSLKEQADKLDTSALEKFGAKMQDIGGKVEAVGKKFMPVTAAVGAVGAAGIAAAKDLDTGYDTIITKTGATGEALEGLTDQMDEIFANIPTDAETAGVAIGEVNTRFGLTGDALGDLSQKFIEFAEINGTDLNSSIDSVDSIMTKFGVDSSHTGDVLGLMTKVGQDTGLSMDTLYSALETNGATLKEMGLGLTESVNLMAQFEASGVDSSTALAALKKAQQNATAEGKTMNEALSEQIDAIKGASTETEALQIATDLFGKKGAAEMTQAIREGRFSVDELSGSLEDYSSTVEDTYNATLDPWDQLTVATNNLKLAGADLAGELLKTLQPVIDGVVNKVKQLTNWFKNLDDDQKQMIVKIGLVVAAIGPALVIGGKIISTVGKVSSGISGVISNVGGLISKLGGLPGVISAIASPVGVVVAAIAALAAGFVYLYNTNDEFREKVNVTIENFKASFSGMVESIKPLLENLKQAFQNLMTALQPVFEFILQTIGAIVNGIMNSVAPIIAAVTNVVDFVTNIISAFTSLLQGDFEGFFSSISAALQNVIDFVENLIMTQVEFIIGFFEAFGVDVKQIFTDIWNGIVQTFQNAGTWFKDKFTEAWKNIENAFKNAGSWFTQRWTDIKNALSQAASWFGTQFQNAWTNVTNAFKNAGSWFGQRWSDIKNAFSNTASWFGTQFQNAWTSVTSAFKNAGSWFKTNVIDAIKKVFDNFSLKDAGERIMNGFISAIKSIHLPRLSIEWGSTSKSIGDFEISIPVPHISWNAAGGIFKDPGIAGIYGGKLQGVGERGPEAVLPLDEFYDRVETYIDAAIARVRATNGPQPAPAAAGGTYNQTINNYSPKALSPYETARQTRNATRNMILRIQKGGA